MRDHRKLLFYQDSLVIVRKIYDLTSNFHVDEKFGLTSQMRRAAVSVCSNIAEGCGRSTNKDLSRFLDMSIGSLCELEAQLDIVKSMHIGNRSTESPRLIEKSFELIGNCRSKMINFKKQLLCDGKPEAGSPQPDAL